MKLAASKFSLSLLLTSLITGGVAGFYLPPAPARMTIVGWASFLGPPKEDLEFVMTRLAFQVRIPVSPPQDLILFDVSWTPPEGADGVTVYSVDLIFRALDREQRRLHIWQTLNPTLVDQPKTDPASPMLGEGIRIDDREWRMVRLQRGDLTIIQLGHRFEDGITMTVDGTGLSIQELLQAASSLEKVTKLSQEWLERLGLLRSSNDF